MFKFYTLIKFNKTVFSRYLFSCLISFLLLNAISFLAIEETYAGQAILSWNPPAKNVDGTPLTDLAGYKVYYGTASGNYSQNINVGNITTYTVQNLTDGITYYFTATAYDTSNNESSYSNEVSKTISPSQQYVLSVNKGGAGTITSSPAGISCGSVCS
jgi:hypothetical protein